MFSNKFDWEYAEKTDSSYCPHIYPPGWYLFRRWQPPQLLLFSTPASCQLATALLSSDEGRTVCFMCGRVSFELLLSNYASVPCCFWIEQKATRDVWMIEQNYSIILLLYVPSLLAK